ncbi:MAG: Ig-like domain-containing protein [Rubrivivax sp.]|nr:Ig-like domain-containing protein [Rubrivivax sp.]
MFKRCLARLAGPVCLSLALAACGGGGGGGGGSTPPVDPGVAGAPYFPLAIGDRWRALEDGTLSVGRVMDTATLDGTPTFRLRVEDSDGITDLYYAKTDTGVTLVPAPADDELTRAIGRVEVLRFPLRAGTSHVPVDKSIPNLIDADGDGRAETLRFRMEVTVVGFERLDTLVGTLEQVLHTRTVTTQSVTLTSNGAPITVTVTTDDWYAPDIGPVRSTTTVVGNGVTENSTWTLQGYRAGSRSSDTVVPTIVARTPADGSTGRTPVVSLTFSEAVDRATVAADALRLTGPGGVVVPGQLQWTGDTQLGFVPSAALASGSYTVTLAAGTEDLLGNRMAAPTSWQFTLDIVGPTVVAWSPADQATDVALSPAISITFDEPLDPATVNASNFVLSTGTTTVAAPVSVSGRVVTLTPASPLQKGVSYTVSLGGSIADPAGNLLSGSPRISFVTDPGRFALPAGVPALVQTGTPVANAWLADTDGDGRADLLASLSDGGFGGRLVVVRRNADGTLAGTAASVGPFSSCNTADAAVADFDGDGLPDIAAAAPFCGLQWARQTAGGFTLQATLASSAGAVGALTLAGSARPGLVATVDNFVRLWRPGPGSDFAAPETIYTGSSQLSNLVLGDINGDGRMDIVLGAALGSTRGLVLLLQRADGGFDTQTLENASWLGVEALADIDGDGRNDLLVSEISPSTALLLLRQTAAGTLAQPVRLDFGTRPARVAVADLNGDGRRDILVSHTGQLLSTHLATQRADGSFAVADPFEFSVAPALQVHRLLVADFSGDGLGDVLVGNQLLRQRLAPATPSGVNGPGTRLRLGVLRGEGAR